MKSRYDELQRGSWSMPSGRQKLAVLEEMILIADRYMTERDGYDARTDYMHAAIEAGSRERLLIVYPWILSKFRSKPDEYSAHNVLWHYKWVLNELWRLPEISLELTERIFDDFKQECLKHGFNLRPYYQQQVSFLLSRGMEKEAAEAYKQWRSVPRDSLADCRACEQNRLGDYQFSMNHNKRGLQTVRPILEGQMRCMSIPQNTYSNVIVPMLKLKQYEQAEAIAKKAYRSIQGPQFLDEHGSIIRFYTVVDIAKAEKRYNETIRFALDSKVGWDRFHYFLGVRAFLREWHKKKRRKKLAEADTVTLEWLDREIESLAEAFNRRNGNTYMNRYIQESDKQMASMIRAYQA